MFVLGLCGMALIAFSFGRISNNYVYQNFQNTQYNKICWFLQKCERGDFAKSKYKGIFVGSSQLYYGINDSLLGQQYLNLGFNTPSKDMDLFVLETFFKSGGKTERVFLGVSGDKLVSYGIHPMLPYLVSPKWLLKHGQKLYSLHFWKFVVIRSQKVLESFFSPKEKNIIVFNRNYGVGYLDQTLSRSKPDDDVQVQKSKFNDHDMANGCDEVRHNICSQWLFFKQIKSKYKPAVLILPSYVIANKFEKMQQFTQGNEYLKGLKVFSLNANFNKVLEKRQNWADPGHLNRQGGICFSDELKKIISIGN
jgi:hypothetical protein